MTGLPFTYKQLGYFDESEDQDFLCIAGLFGPAHHWQPFNDAWAAVLGEVGVAEFHTQECENRKGFWESWNDPTKRRAVQQRFLDLIVKNPSPSPVGVVVGIDLRGFRATVGPAIKTLLPRQGLDKPWISAFMHVLGRLVDAQGLSNEMTGQDERVDLYFDEKDEFRGRVENMLTEANANSDYPLGGVTFCDSRVHPGLQAADLVAYEARRCLTEVILGTPPKPVREQWVQLMEAKLPSGAQRVWGDLWDVETMTFMVALDESGRQQ
jgi:hypothetical protein